MHRCTVSLDTECLQQLITGKGIKSAPDLWAPRPEPTECQDLSLVIQARTRHECNKLSESIQDNYQRSVFLLSKLSHRPTFTAVPAKAASNVRRFY